jgi:hypothetical protein
MVKNVPKYQMKRFLRVLCVNANDMRLGCFGHRRGRQEICVCGVRCRGERDHDAKNNDTRAKHSVRRNE